jgi:putative endonuclease
MKDKKYFVYILASQKNGTSYTGFTSNLEQRIWQHKNSVVDSFTKKYNIKILVYFEIHEDVNKAIKREKQIKK